MLLQCALMGKAQKIYLSIPIGNYLDFLCACYTNLLWRLTDNKDTRLMLSLLVLKKLSLTSSVYHGVGDHTDLRQLELMEDFKNCLHESDSIYLDEQSY